MITPTVGRMVWIRNRPSTLDPRQPESGQITYVHSDRLVNVAGYDANGRPFEITSLPLLQDGDPVPTYQHAEWMPYQKGQAARTDTSAAAQAKAETAASVLTWLDEWRNQIPNAAARRLRAIVGVE